MTALPAELTELIQAGPLAHLTTINPDGSPQVSALMNPYAVLNAHATVEPSDEAWDLLNRLTKVYVSPDTEFPVPKGPGYIIRYEVDRIGGVGPWA